MFEPGTSGIRVRLIDNPNRQGITTGHFSKSGTHVLVEVELGPNDRPYMRLNLLEEVPTSQGLDDLLTSGRFGGPEDLRRVLTLRKLRGTLTNVFYSMESSNTIFMPHQFKPVLKFVESYPLKQPHPDSEG